MAAVPTLKLADFRDFGKPAVATDADLTVKRLPTLTPYRRPRLTPLKDRLGADSWAHLACWPGSSFGADPGSDPTPIHSAEPGQYAL